jgi:hypothetical protein
MNTGAAMNWHVRVDGPGPILHQLALAISDHDIRLLRRDSIFVLAGSRLDALDDAGAAQREADRIITILSASARLSFGSTEPLEAGDIVEAFDDGSRPDALDDPGDPDSWSRRSSLSKCVRAALDDPEMEQALRLRNAGDLDWPALERIHRIIEQAEGRRAKPLPPRTTLAEARSVVDRLLIAWMVTATRPGARLRRRRSAS